MNKEKEKNIDRYLNTGELMDMLSVSRSTVYRLMAKGMPNILVGSVHRFPQQEVLKWLREITGDTSRNSKSQDDFDS